MKNILIFGSGGHASVVIDIAQQEKKYEIIGIIDEPKNYNEISGLPILSNISTIKKVILEKDVFGGIIAIGDNAKSLGENSIAIGTNVTSSEDNLVKLGNDNSNVKIDGDLFVKNVDIIEKLKFLENEINKLK